MNVLELFAGAGGGILGGMLCGDRTVCAVEFNAYARSVLLARQADGTFPHFPVWDDVRTFDGRPWRGVVDVVSGGFPCQDISVAGGGAGLDGERSGLWREMARIIGEVRPRFVRIENSPALVTRGLDRVLADLAAMGFDARWGVVSAADTGAHHERERLWILAHANGVRELQPTGGEQNVRVWLGDCSADVADAVREREQGIVHQRSDAQRREGQERRPFGSRCYAFGRWPTEPDVGRVAHGVAQRAQRIKALGNGQVPRVHAAAFTILAGRQSGLMQPPKGRDGNV